jgi:hypothetical protein
LIATLDFLPLMPVNLIFIEVGETNIILQFEHFHTIELESLSMSTSLTKLKLSFVHDLQITIDSIQFLLSEGTINEYNFVSLGVSPSIIFISTF